VVTEDLLLVYDGWHCIAELNTSHSALRTYVWGLDLSGTMDGAGGVGGLLMVNSTANGAHFYAYDGNGNVVGLSAAADGSETARYECEPFGAVLRATGAMAKENRFQFSTKRCDPTADLLLYEYRVLRTDIAKWLSRDPIAENWGDNLYGFVRNDPVRRFDALGESDGGLGWPYPDPKPGEPPPSYPPPMPFPQPPSKMFRKYDCSCCTTEKEINSGLDELKRRFGLAKGHLDPRVKAGRKGGLDANDGGASCAYANSQVLQFMEPTPRCWICFMDRRLDKPAPQLPFQRWVQWDENFIHCFSANPKGIEKEIVFDYFEYRYWNGEYGNGIYEGAQLRKFYEHHPYPAKSDAGGFPKWVNCNAPDQEWKPNNWTLAGVGRGGMPRE